MNEAADAHRTRLLWAAGVLANRRELLRRHRLGEQTATTDLLALLVDRCGSDAATRICGTLSWIGWSDRERQLLVVRARSGEHPVYWARSGDGFLLSPDADAVLAALTDTGGPDRQTLLRHLNCSPPAPGRTYHRNLCVVPPAELLSIRDGRITTRRYWTLEPQPLLRLAADEEYADALRSELRARVAEYSPHAPAAVTLSSGLDSASVAAAWRLAHPAGHLTACCWVAPGAPPADEWSGARETAECLGLDARTVRLDIHHPFSAPAMAGETRTIPRTSLYSECWQETFARLANDGVRHLFTGAYGDVLFGGNVFSYPDLLLTGRWLRLAGELREQLSWSGTRLSTALRRMLLSPLYRWLLPARGTRTAPAAAWIRTAGENCMANAGEVHTRACALSPGRTMRHRALTHPISAWAVERLGAQAARFGIELLHPLGDHRMLEFAASLPVDQSFRAGVRKPIVRNAMRGILPDNALSRRTKITPEALALDALRRAASRWSAELFRNMTLSDLGLVDERRLRGHIDEFRCGRHSDTRFWHAAALEHWLRRHDGGSTDTRDPDGAGDVPVRRHG